MRKTVGKGRGKKRILPWSWLRLVFAACLLTRLVRFIRRPWSATFGFFRFLFLANLGGGRPTGFRVRASLASFGGALSARFAVLSGIFLALHPRVALFPSPHSTVLFWTHRASLFLLFGFCFVFLFISIPFPLLVLLFLVFLMAVTPLPPPVFAGGFLFVFTTSAAAAVSSLPAPLPLSAAAISGPGSSPISPSGSGSTPAASALPGIAALFLVAPRSVVAAPPPVPDLLTAMPMGAAAAAPTPRFVRRRAATPPLPPGAGWPRRAAGWGWGGRRGRGGTTAAVAGGRLGAAAVTICRGAAAASSWTLLCSARELALAIIFLITGPTPLYQGLRLPDFCFLFMWILLLTLIVFPLFSTWPFLYHLFCRNKQNSVWKQGLYTTGAAFD